MISRETRKKMKPQMNTDYADFNRMDRIIRIKGETQFLNF
jgi:hypothetical protein